MTEAKVLKELRNGSEEALAWFIHKYTPYVTTIVHNIIGSTMDTSDIEEVAADVFFTLWENAGSVYSVKGYLGVTARNRAKNKMRESGNDLPLDERLILVDELTPEVQFEQKELSAAVKRAVKSMGEPEREIFLRFYYYYQSLDQISSEMDINLSTVKTKLRRGRVKLKNTIIRYLT